LAGVLAACVEEDSQMTTYSITSNSGMMPNQIFGTTSDGQWFYLRGRYGYVTFTIAPSEEMWEIADDETYLVWHGEIENAGYFEPKEFETLFWQIIDELNDGKKVKSFIPPFSEAQQAIFDLSEIESANEVSDMAITAKNYRLALQGLVDNQIEYDIDSSWAWFIFGVRQFIELNK
jgi:hypothetical protein